MWCCVPQYGRRHRGWKLFHLFWLPLPEKPFVSFFGTKHLEALTLSLVDFALDAKSFLKSNRPQFEKFPSAKGFRSLFKCLIKALLHSTDKRVATLPDNIDGCFQGNDQIFGRKLSFITQWSTCESQLRVSMNCCMDH